MRIALIGFGTVGQGVADLVIRHRDLYQSRCGQAMDIGAVLVRTLGRDRDIQLPDDCLLTDDPDALFATNPDILVEVAGGIEPASSYITRALGADIDVVTANKALIAKHGSSLFALANGRKRALCMEAAVAGGVPALDLLTDCLGANEFATVAGILNGTCNFILTALQRATHTGEAAFYDATLKQAQELGYAEADPTLDVSGRDSAEKLAILCALAFGTPIDPVNIPNQGVEQITSEHIKQAHAAGYAIKLLALAQRDGDSLAISNRPTLVPLDHPIAQVDDADMGLSIVGDAMQSSFIRGSGAGRYPTASAVVADILRVARARANKCPHALNKWPSKPSGLQITDVLDNPARTEVPALEDFPVFA